MEEQPDPLWTEDAPAYVIVGHAHFVEYAKPTRKKKKNPIGFTSTSPSSSADERGPAKAEDGGSNPL